MEDNFLDEQLRDLLGEYSPGRSMSSEGINDPSVIPESEDIPLPESPADPLITEDKIQAWKRIEASLNASDQAFDETVRQRIHHYSPKYDPHSWPVFVQRLSDSRFLRTKLILVKSVEVAALLLLLVTAVNMGRMGKIPFTSGLFNQELQSADENTSTPQKAETQKDNINQSGAPTPVHSNDFTLGSQTADDNFSNASVASGLQHNTLDKTFASAADKGSAIASSVGSLTRSHSNRSAGSRSVNYGLESTLNTNAYVSEIPTLPSEGLTYTVDHATVPEFRGNSIDFTTEPLASAEFLISYTNYGNVPNPKFVTQSHRIYTEFGILTQADYNGLRMPEDHLSSSGKAITFPSKGIFSPGYGAGFTIAVGHPAWALETGIIFSAKDFKPGRQLIVGGAFDNGTVDFEAMKLQLISMPLQYRYRIDHKGRFKSYLMGGGALSVIAQSNIDVQIKYHFASLSFGENPNNDPNLAQTIKETRRVREHIRDGAPFSTKSFVSANAGLGFEYMISEHKAFFLQSMLQYQIPNISFSNNNGKHLRSVSIQAGVRGPLGK